MSESSPRSLTDQVDLDGSRVVETYLDRTRESAKSYERTKKVIAGGTSRQTSHWGPYPLVIERGLGPHVWDVDGNKYWDIINNYTALIHGHLYPPVEEAARRAIDKGILWSANNVYQTGLAEQIVERVPSVDQLRFTNSGTEAANLGLLIARNTTNRKKILMARYGYHGVIQDFQTGSFGHSSETTLVADYNDLSDFERIFAAHGDEIAGVFLEPMLGASGVLAGERDFLAGVHKLAQHYGALFVLDEVQTFRLHAGGLQAKLGLEPDLTLFGKFIGGGYPIGAVGGKSEVMNAFNPDDLKVYHSGTFNANPVTMAAGNAAVRHLTPESISHMDSLCRRLADGLEDAARGTDMPFSVNRLGSLMNLFFMSAPPGSMFDRTDFDHLAKFHLAAMNRGVFLSSRGYIVLSTVMNHAMIDDIIDRCAAAFDDLAQEVGA